MNNNIGHKDQRELTMSPEVKNQLLKNYITAKKGSQDLANVEQVADALRKLILNNVVKALERFYERDRFLLENKMNERTICCRLAIYLHELFQDFTGYYVDAEYYRSTVPPNEIKDKRSQRILCDLLLHSRRQYDDTVDNLLALEVKLFDNEDRVDSDLHRLYDFALPKTSSTPVDAIHDTLVTLFIRMEESGYTICEIKSSGFKNMSNSEDSK